MGLTLSGGYSLSPVVQVLSISLVKVVSHVGVIMAWMSLLLPSGAAGVLELRKGDVVAFSGGTDLINIQKEGRLESALTMKWRENTPLFRDFAWDGDTVYHQSAERERWRQDAFGNWEAQLKRAGATVVLAQFGKMESLDGLERVAHELGVCKVPWHFFHDRGDPRSVVGPLEHGNPAPHLAAVGHDVVVRRRIESGVHAQRVGVPFCCC